jgi:MFS family permease
MQTSEVPSFAHPAPALHRNIWILSITSLLTDVSSEMLANLLPLFLANVLGVRTVYIGLIEGVAETTASLFKLVSGAISDRLQKRKALAVAGYGLSSLVKPLLFFANSWVWVLGVRFADRLGKGIRTAPRDALIAASIQPAQRGLAFGLHRAADTAGAFLGIGIAALIIWANPSPDGLLTRPIFQTVVLASIIPAFLAVIILALGGRDIHPAHDAAAGGTVAQTPAGRLDRRFYFFLAAVILFTLGNSSDAFIILRAQERGLPVGLVLVMLLSFNLVYSLLSGPAGVLSDRVGRRRVIIAGWLLYALIYLGLAAAQNGMQVWVLFALYGVFYALTEGASKAYVADLIPPELRGTAYGLFHGAVGLAALPASLVAGLLWQGAGGWTGFGPAAPFLFGAALGGAAVILFTASLRPRVA